MLRDRLLGLLADTDIETNLANQIIFSVVRSLCEGSRNDDQGLRLILDALNDITTAVEGVKRKVLWLLNDPVMSLSTALTFAKERVEGLDEEQRFAVAFGLLQSTRNSVQKVTDEDSPNAPLRDFVIDDVVEWAATVLPMTREEIRQWISDGKIV